MKLSRKERRAALQGRLGEDPFLTDDQLAAAFGVSVATIRLDRMALAIPELRVRAETIASNTYAQVKALRGEEVVGDLVELNLGQSAASVLEVGDHMVFARTGLLREHFLFAQGNSLAVALVNSKLALTESAHVRYYRPLKRGDRVVAKAKVAAVEANHFAIEVEGRVQDEVVFQGEYIVVDAEDKGGEERG